MSARWEHQSDEELLRAARRDPHAFGEFYRRHEEAVLRFFMSRVGDAEVAADLAAETFAATLAGLGRFRPRRGAAAAWLFGIARNTLAMSSRRGQVEARARRRMGMPPLELTDELLERIDALDGPALAVVRGLPAQQKEAVRARVIDERDYDEIAKDLRCSEAVVRKRVSRGLARMREELGEG